MHLTSTLSDSQNVELIARLEERGRFLATVADDEDSGLVGDESNASWSVVPAGSASSAQLEADFGPAGGFLLLASRCDTGQR